MRIDGSSSNGANYAIVAKRVNESQAPSNLPKIEKQNNSFELKNKYIRVKDNEKEDEGLIRNVGLKELTEKVIGNKYDISNEKKIQNIEEYAEKISEQYNAGEGKELGELEKVIGKEINDKEDYRAIISAMAGQAGVLEDIAKGASDKLTTILKGDSYKTQIGIIKDAYIRNNEERVISVYS